MAQLESIEAIEKRLWKNFVAKISTNFKELGI
jgi:hypothetical protein